MTKVEASSELLVNVEKWFADDPEEMRGTLRAALEAPQCSWRFFKKQIDLLDSLQSQRRLGMMPFVFHHAVSGRRIFVLVHPLELLHRTINRSINYFYEIITEVPSKLYLDLEYDKKMNPNVDGEAMTKIVISLFLNHLKERFGVTLDESVIIDLDSSSDVKFSRHVIFNTFFAFRDNQQIGHIVRQVTRDGLIPQLRVSSKDGKPTCFVDLAVYTRNRHFRILGSRKFTGAASLEAPERFSKNRLELEAFFLASLVTAGRAPVVDLPPPPPGILPELMQERKRPKAEIGSSGMPPEVDAFFERILAGAGMGKVMRYEGGVAVYASGPGGVCANKGKAHLRHRVLWFVASRLGTFHQRCGDLADCPRFRSPREPLPTPLLLAARPPLDAFERALALPRTFTKEPFCLKKKISFCSPPPAKKERLC